MREARGTGPPAVQRGGWIAVSRTARFEPTEGRVILGAASSHEARAGVAAPEADRRRAEAACGQAFEEGEREPGEVAPL